MQREQKTNVSTSSDFLEDEKHIHSSAAVKKMKRNMQSKSSHTGKKPKAKSHRDVRDNLPEGSYGSKDTLENESADPRPKEKPWTYGCERDSDAPGISRRETYFSLKHDKHLASEEQKMHIPPPATVSTANAAPVVIEEHWVSCDICDKWRLLPYEMNTSNIPKKWKCSMLHWLPGMNRCEISEEETTNALNALYICAPANDIPAVLVGHLHVASSVLNRVGRVDDKQIPQFIPLKNLRETTNDFSKERILGSGTFGTVYKGVLDGKEVAVKLLHCSMPQKLNYEEEFMKEFENLRRLNHPNIVRLLGYCYETKQVVVEYEGRFVLADKIDRALCFDYMQNGSLQQHLADESCGLDWNTRYKIIKGTCEGLKYLHKGFENPMFHLDLKPGNVLLDKNMVPKLADFGLSKLVCDNQTRATSSFLGTIGYCPPEHIDHYLFSDKFDIFSLGVVMIEIIAGPKGYRKAVEMSPRGFIDHVQENWRKRIHRAIPACTLPNYECRQVKRCIEIALECVHRERMQRPDIEDIISRLNKTENKY